MSDLRTAAQQALEDLKDLHANHNITYAGTISRLAAALAQQQPNPPRLRALQPPPVRRHAMPCVREGDGAGRSKGRGQSATPLARANCCRAGGVGLSEHVHRAGVLGLEKGNRGAKLEATLHLSTAAQAADGGVGQVQVQRNMGV